ncbi:MULTISPECIES: nucleotide sugar dehydrogenase [Streptomycetaceae]|uniref:Nucleotide sugar dehydrogenase n=1 Tax=Streptantibioticus cattleyicolor (strain ATCC 35852 / DSM 46488 / JCM 4925 / NBRC 14057 / NRRL 8057) TaxID=1003195 RepID=F8K3Y7_STREN|nr:MULTISPECIES: nucleotide sugar dehydrogenase [Streptomycetaceae]AEW96028.1 nucleotide sugar dehydrogenase [Streptantibioticus cattleyicolor NRRL 8057 = DSM 46488]MYS60559.1 nucleotide sugar dehydrogenase [Streptomyces sp. SID5468]CCB76362.1 putative UDP-glucose/GDP-mannose dehydrogenase [Streptantibioticus cattleyicolor NRRL 8057 = DSM 46488]
MPADLAVIGLRHVGLPLAQAATAAGIGVIGYDTDPAVTDGVNAGRSPVEWLAAADIRRMLAAGFRATGDPAVLGRARTAVICAPTPPGADLAPDLTAVTEAARTLAAHLRPHTTVVLESTAAPGTTEDVLRPILENGSGLRAGRDFHLAYSPHRADPGRRDRVIANTPKVIGGLTPACTEAAAAFYGRITDRVVRARGPREAEAAKLLEAVYRHVNIALVNEMAVFCHESGIDVWDVIRCAETKPFGFQPFRPGPGVGGHDVPPAGPALPLRMADLARQVNSRMPRYVVQRCAALLNEHGKSVRGARILLLGVTYKADLGDQEGAPAREIGARLLDLGATLGYHDPYVPEWRLHDRPVPRADSLWEAAADADLTVLLQHHRTYDLQGLAVKAQLLLDTRGATPTGTAARL